MKSLLARLVVIAVVVHAAAVFAQEAPKPAGDSDLAKQLANRGFVGECVLHRYPKVQRGNHVSATRPAGRGRRAH